MLRRTVFLIIAPILLSGCGSSSFVGRRVDNFTAYYNAFYNARKAYEAGFESIAERDLAVNRNEYLPLFVRPSGQTANRNFDDAVLKSADVLRKHGDSKWVDDALLLIGKAYFYQENFVGALQKFREVIDRGSELEDEARFWLARTLIISRSYDEALAALQGSLAREDVPARWRASFQMALGELYVQRQDWDEAATALSDGLSSAKDKEIASRAQFLLGQVYETMGRFDEAAAAYRNVRKFRPLYELSFAAQLSAIRVEGLHGEPVRALRDLRKMERDDKHFEYRDDLKLLRGRIIQSTGAADEAYNVYFDLLYDPNRIDAIKPELLGKVHYAIAELHRDLDGDFVLASAHFDTAAQYIDRPASAGGRGRVNSEQHPPEAITDAAEMKEQFGLYATVHGKVADMDSLLWLGSLDDEAFEAQILVYRQERARVMEQERKEREARLLEQQFRQAAGSQNGFQDRNLPPGKINPLSQNELARAGFLFHRDQVRVDEGRSSFAAKWGDRPRVSNWRRIDAVRSQPAELLEQVENASNEIDMEDPTQLPEIDVSSVPRDSLARVEMLSDRAVARYELGNAFFLGLGMPDSAATWYRLVIEETPSEPVAQRAYYALAEVQKLLGDTLSSERLYDEILEKYPESEFSTKILTRRGEYREEATPDSATIAQEIYDMVYRDWQSGATRGIIDQMILLAAAYPKTDAGAKSMLAGAQVHLEIAGSDTTALLAPIPLLVPDSLLIKLWPEKDQNYTEAIPPATAMSVGNPVKDTNVPSTGRTAEPGVVEAVQDSVRNLDSRTDATARAGDAQGVATNRTDSSAVALPGFDPRASVPNDAIGLTEQAEMDLEGLRVDARQGQLRDSLVAGSGVLDADSLGADVGATVLDADSLAAETLTAALDSSTVREPEGLERLPTDVDFAETDSAVVGGVFPDSSGLNQTVSTTDSLGVDTDATGGDIAQKAINVPVSDSVASNGRDPLRPANQIPIYVDDLFEYVARNFVRTPYEARSRTYLSLLDELRNPPVEPEFNLAVSDSMDFMGSDSTGVAVSDSTGILMPDSTVAPVPDTTGVLMPDSTGVIMSDTTNVAGQSNSTDVPADSVRGAATTNTPPIQSASNDSSKVNPPKDLFDEFGNPIKKSPPANEKISKEPAASPSPDSSAEAAPGSAELLSGDQPEFPDTVIEPEDPETIGDFEETSDLKPINSAGQLQPGVSGWTVILDRVSGESQARVLFDEFREILEETGKPVMLLTDSIEPDSEYFICWGLFPSYAAADQSVREAASPSLRTVNYLLVHSSENE